MRNAFTTLDRGQRATVIFRISHNERLAWIFSQKFFGGPGRNGTSIQILELFPKRIRRLEGHLSLNKSQQISENTQDKSASILQSSLTEIFREFVITCKPTLALFPTANQNLSILDKASIANRLSFRR
jgi:hypothetical protein